MRDRRHVTDRRDGEARGLKRAKRALAARSTAEARLQAMQARVDPPFLFDVLGAVESLHEASPEAVLPCWQGMFAQQPAELRDGMTDMQILSVAVCAGSKGVRA